MGNCKSYLSESFNWLMATCVVIWIKRVVPLLTSLWMEVDMVLDVRQTLIYYEHAFNPNGTYFQWAQEFNKTTNDDMETVHPGYFYSSIIFWVLSPFLLSAVVFLGNVCDDEYNPFENTNGLFKEFLSIEFNPPFKKKYQNILFSVFYLPFELLISAIWIYIVIPFASLKSGIIIAVTGENDGKREIMKVIEAELT